MPKIHFSRNRFGVRAAHTTLNWRMVSADVFLRAPWRFSAAKKNKIISEKTTLTEKVADIEKRGVSWLEPAREFVLSLNQAENLLSQNNLVGMTAFLKNIGVNHSLRNRQFEFSPKLQYALAASLCEAASEHLRFTVWYAHQGSNLD